MNVSDSDGRYSPSEDALAAVMDALALVSPLTRGAYTNKFQGRNDLKRSGRRLRSGGDPHNLQLGHFHGGAGLDLVEDAFELRVFGFLALIADGANQAVQGIRRNGAIEQADF